MLFTNVFCRVISNFRHSRFKIQNVRSFITGIKPVKMNEKHYITKDNIPKDFSIIYRAPMENYLSLSKNITTITAGIVTMACGYNFILGEQINSAEPTLYSGLLFGESDLTLFAVGFILITAILRIFISKYPLRIYRNDKSYIAVFQGQLPFANAKIYFKRGEVSVPNANSLNPWTQSMYKIKDTNVILLSEYFKTPAEFNMLFIKNNNKTLP